MTNKRIDQSQSSPGFTNLTSVFFTDTDQAGSVENGLVVSASSHARRTPTGIAGAAEAGAKLLLARPMTAL